MRCSSPNSMKILRVDKMLFSNLILPHISTCIVTYTHSVDNVVLVNHMCSYIEHEKECVTPLITHMVTDIVMQSTLNCSHKKAQTMKMSYRVAFTVFMQCNHTLCLCATTEACAHAPRLSQHTLMFCPHTHMHRDLFTYKRCTYVRILMFTIILVL